MMGICVGCGLWINPDHGLLEVELAPGGGITCSDAGLAVTFPTPPPTYLPVRSDEACNGLHVREGGSLFAFCPDAIVGVHQTVLAPISQTINTLGGGADDYDYPSDIATITNNLCCTVEGRISLRAGGFFLLAQNGFHGTAEIQVNTGAGWASSFPSTHQVINNLQGAAARYAWNGFYEENLLALGVGASTTYQARVHIHVFAGTAVLEGTPGFEFNWVCPQTGCCLP